MVKEDRDRDADGRFSGLRVDVEQVPRLPPFLHAGSSTIHTFDDGGPQRLTILRGTLPRGTSTALFYRCSWCHKPRRYLYLLTLSGTKLVSDLGLRCQACARLRFGSQGHYRSAFSRAFVTAFYHGLRTSE